MVPRLVLLHNWDLMANFGGYSDRKLGQSAISQALLELRKQF
jgi:hypothetical protein